MVSIALTKGYVAWVDEEDVERVSRKKWRAQVRQHTVYAHTTFKHQGTCTDVLLHRFILQAKQGSLVDHVDGNGINCCRSNMRLCTWEENNRNRHISSSNKSGHKGVRFDPRTGKYHARIWFSGKRISLGTFSSAEAAADRYNATAKKLFGEFARGDSYAAGRLTK